MTRSSTIGWAVLVAAAAIAIHARGLRGELLGPDRVLVDRSPLVSAASSDTGSSLPTWAPRVVAALSLAKDRAIYGVSPAGFRASSLALHAVCSLLLFALGARMTRSPAAAGAGALVFAAHPAAVETIDLTAGRGEILATVFTLAALLLLFRSREAEGSPGRGQLALGLALAAYIAASLSSALALVLPLVLLAAGAFEPASDRRARPRARELALFTAASVPALVFCFTAAPPVPPGNRWLMGRALLEAVRVVVLPFPLDYYRTLSTRPGAGASALAGLAVAALLIALLTMILARGRRTPRAGASATRPLLAGLILAPAAWILLATLSGPPAALGYAGLLVAPAVLLAASYGAAASHRLAAIPSALPALLTIVPLLTLAVLPPEGPGSDLPFPLLDRSLYLPAAGFGLLIAVALSTWAPGASRVPERPEARAASPAQGAPMRGAPQAQGFALSLAAASLAVPLAAVSVSRHGDFQTDTRLYASAAARSPSTRLRVLLAQSMAAQGLTEQAIETVKGLIVREPGDANLHLLLANLLRDVRDLDASEEQARAALRIDPKLAGAEVTLGLIARERGDAPQAEAAYREAARIDPALDEAHSNLGALLSLRGATAEALAELKHAVELDPANGDAAANLASLLLDQKLIDEAIATAQQGLAFAAGNPRLHYVLGAALQKKGNQDGAERAYLDAIRLSPAYARPRFNLASIYSERKAYGDAVRELTRVCELEPRNERAHYNLGLMYRQMGRTDLASAEFLAALKIRPDFPEANRALTGLFSPGGIRPGSSGKP